MPVGVFLEQNYLEGKGFMDRGETLVLYTDGLTEARNQEDEEFGMERLIDTSREEAVRDSESMTQGVIRKIRDEWLATDQEDDWTMMVLKRAAVS